MYQLAAFASGVLADINTFYRYTGNSANLFHALVSQFPRQSRSWAARFDRGLNLPPAHALHPINPDNAWGLCITATAGTELVTSYS